MMNQKEMQEFNERLEGVKVAFPYLKQVKIIDDKSIIDGMHVLNKDYKEVNMMFFSTVMCVGSTVVNVSGNSPAANIEILCKIMMNVEYQGRIGFLM